MGLFRTPAIMEPASNSAEQLRKRIAEAEDELKALKEQLAQVVQTAAEGKEEGKAELSPPLPERQSPERRKTGAPVKPVEQSEAAVWKWPLGEEEYERYGRQLILPQVGINGQKRLKASRVLVIGAGGLGCPAAAYLAGAGVGTLGVADGDTVEASNLHRQIAHSTSRVGVSKVVSLVAYCKELNPLVNYIPHADHLTPTNAEEIVSQYDLVLDCTDHPTSRYLISDICVLLNKPLVSASALRTDGQLIVLNTPPTPQGSVATTAPPCYRCVFPKPPPPEAVVSCGEGGILGPVVGVMGVLQALEAIKVISAGLHMPGAEGIGAAATAAPPTLLLFSGATPGAPSFRSVKMRSRRKDCFACGQDGEANLTLDTLRSGSLDYLAFCGGMSAPIKVLAPEQRISAHDFREQLCLLKPSDFLLLDVREKELFDIAHIDGAVNVPYSRIQSSARRQPEGALPDWIPAGLGDDVQIYVICRVSNDSQMVAKQLIELGLGRGGARWIGDIEGGMRDWKNWVDPTLPFL
ncbi:hypothetical protein N0V93_003711 [Gnomoniopsis smithogilvyi]|uniref:Adenylyltransferase and sulfurtransferase uba4 n=1 Tax=Gnomoniopsis smithogilvyi TaxID=1191159 RepID=A0A9W8YZ34_9PEZI|nr:hypothetical protein N0V93_003711 [Gnomoniopsis smithogilvyi]